jgi:hypothetical protein
MPGLEWQRRQLIENYSGRVVGYARKHCSSRQEAESRIEREFEREFERVGQEQVEREGNSVAEAVRRTVKQQ